VVSLIPWKGLTITRWSGMRDSPAGSCLMLSLFCRHLGGLCSLIQAAYRGSSAANPSQSTEMFDEPPGECRKSAESASKPRLELLPVAALEQIAGALTFGAGKYGDHNWCRGARWGRYYAALLRHLFAWWSGENCDPETGLSHLAHAGACLLFLIEYETRGWGSDDRYRGPDGGTFTKNDGSN
jgi:hypothetical protein